MWLSPLNLLLVSLGRVRLHFLYLHNQLFIHMGKFLPGHLFFRINSPSSLSLALYDRCCSILTVFNRLASEYPYLSFTVSCSVFTVMGSSGALCCYIILLLKRIGGETMMKKDSWFEMMSKLIKRRAGEGNSYCLLLASKWCLACFEKQGLSIPAGFLRRPVLL